MVCHYILCSAGNSHASDWWSGNYASILYAKANLDSQRISDFLTSIGDEYSYREFFKVYLKFVTKEDRDGTSILIDSTGLPNSIHFPLTAISNHNGEISNEVRLIYVTHQETGLPIYFRYCPGNVIDTTTLTRTMAELKQSGVNIKFSILDAGYYDIENVTCLYNDGISFVMRLKENTVLYKTMLKEHFDSLACPENFISYNDRYAYMKRVKCELLPACPGYVYIGLDLDRRNSEEGKLFKRAKRAGMKDKDVLEHMEKQGIFMLVSSRPIAKDKILPTYYTRQQIEQIFDIGKNYANMLPLRVQSEDTLRGHLLLTFIASVIVKEMQDRLKKSTYNITSMLLNLRNQKCKVYEKEVVTQEAFKKANDCYKLFKIECPVQIPRAIV
jgi:transposase